jgi:hypothetical protein
MNEGSTSNIFSVEYPVKKKLDFIPCSTNISNNGQYPFFMIDASSPTSTSHR